MKTNKCYICQQPTPWVGTVFDPPSHLECREEADVQDGEEKLSHLRLDDVIERLQEAQLYVKSNADYVTYLEERLSTAEDELSQLRWDLGRLKKIKER